MTSLIIILLSFIRRRQVHVVVVQLHTLCLKAGQVRLNMFRIPA